jgi:hypothetical protein
MDNKNELLNEEKELHVQGEWTEEQEKKQQELGKQIDEYRQYNKWLKNNKHILQDDRFILYRLPLTPQQREKVFKQLWQEELELKKEEAEKKEKQKKNNM